MDKSERVEITKSILEKLDEEIARTGMSPRIFYKHVCKHPPECLKAHTIENWLAGRSTHTAKHLLDYVLERYQSSPDEAVTLRLTDERVSELETALTEANRTPAQIVRLAGQDAPKGLNAELISKWKHGKVKTAKRIQWDFVLKICKKLANSQNR